MMATAFAPILLSPVGHEALSCTGSSLTFRFRPSPCPNHYDGRLATMPSADFCLITHRVTPAGAIGFHLIRSCKVMNPACQGLIDQWPHCLSTDRLLSRSPRTLFSTPLRGIRACTVPAPQGHFVTAFGRTAASFTVAVRSRGFDVLCHLAFSLRLI